MGADTHPLYEPYKGHHPTSEAILAMVARLERVQQLYPETAVRMMQGHARVQFYSTDLHPCGTTACHAGYYILARYHELEAADDPRKDDFSFSSRGAVEYTGGELVVQKGDEPKRLQCSFLWGADWMASDLGFSDEPQTIPEAHFGPSRLEEDLTHWAVAHPELWGNPNGDAMFCGDEAFGWSERTKPRPVLQDIIDHWRGVAERVREREERGA